MDDRPCAMYVRTPLCAPPGGDIRGPMCSVVDSSMSVHSKASGNFPVLARFKVATGRKLSELWY